MRRLIFIAIFSLITHDAGTVFAQNSPLLSSDVAARVDRVFKRWDKLDSPGCALGVYKDGQIVYKRGYGMADLNNDVPISPSTIFHVASMSKQFTAASTVLLAQQGKLSLDDDVRKYVQELPDFGERITIRQLIHHTSGLRDQWELLELAGWRYSLDLITDEDVMSVMVRQKQLNFKPGEKHVYCNTGYTLMGLIVKRVTGMSLREFTTKNIFEPLGMMHTHFRDDHAEIVKHNAIGYEQEDEGKPFRLSVTNFDTVGATSLHTTVEDLQLWDENFYRPRVGGTGFVQQMLERGKLNSGEVLKYAFALEEDEYRGLRTVDHGGGDAGYRSDMVRFPDQHFSAAVLCNSAETNPTGLTRQVADVVLEKELKPMAEPGKGGEKGASTAVVPAEVASLAGTYWSRDEDEFAKIVLKDGKLRVDTGQLGKLSLKPVAELRFHFEGVPWGDLVELHFVGANGNRPRGFERSLSGGKPTFFEAVTPWTPSVQELGPYVAAYTSPEIDPVYRIALEDGKLSLSRPKHKPQILLPTVNDVFFGEIGTVRFTRDAQQQISGFVLNAGRIRNFRFDKKTE